MLKKLLSIVVYILLFLFSTLLFTYFMFPLDKLKEYIEDKANMSPKYRLEIGSMERDGLGTLVLSEVTVGMNKKLFRKRVRKPAQVKPEGEEGGEKPEEAGPEEDFSYVDIDEIVLEFSPLDLLNPIHIELHLSMELLGGTISDGRIDLIRHEGKTVSAMDFPSIQELDLGNTEFFGSLFSAILPSMKSDMVSGILESGSISLEPQFEEVEDEDVEDDDEGPKETRHYVGRIDIELTDIVALSPILVQRLKRTNQTVEVPLTDLKLGDCRFKIRVDRKDRIEELDKVKTKHDDATVVLFEKGECKGESLDYLIRENSFILFPAKGPFSKGRMDLWTRMAFNPDYFEEERVQDGKAVTRNKEMGQGLEFDRRWQKAQDVDGFYWMHCKGTLSKPKCRRGLPKAEKIRKKAKRKLEKAAAKKKKKAAAKKKKAAAKKKKAAAKKKKKKEKKDRSAAARKRREEAKKRAEKARKKREEARKRPTLKDLRTPSGPGGEEETAGGEAVPGEEDYPPEEGTDEMEGEGDEYAPEEGVEDEDHIPDVVSQPDVVHDARGPQQQDVVGEVEQPANGRYDPALVPFP